MYQSLHTYARPPWVRAHVYTHIYTYMCVCVDSLNTSRVVHRLNTMPWLIVCPMTLTYVFPDSYMCVCLIEHIARCVLHTMWWRVTAHLCMSHCTHMHEPHECVHNACCIQWVTTHTHVWVREHICKSHGTHMCETPQTDLRGTTHISATWCPMSIFKNTWYFQWVTIHTHTWVMEHICTSHGIHMCQ